MIQSDPQVQPDFCVGVILLGAGQSRRMGRPKLLLPWQGTTILGHLIAQWRAVAATQVAIVCANADQIIQEELDRLGFPRADRLGNPTPERGMFSSIQCAARWNGWRPVLTHFAIVLGDQPHLRSTTLRGLLEFAHAHPRVVCQPAHNGRRRHPVLLPKAIWRQLAESHAADLKEFLTRLPLAVRETEDPGLDLDIDLPEDYERALSIAAEDKVKDKARN